MPRFQLLVRELGKAPRVVSLIQTLVVGRSRRADVVLEDEEVGREQFRVGPEGALVFVEGVGKTNSTTVDGTVLAPGQRVTVTIGATIKVGRSSLVVQTADATESAPPRPGSVDATLFAGGGPGTKPVPAEQEQTNGYRGPMNTIDFQRPGAPAAGPAASGRAPAGSAPSPANPEQTISAKQGFRPGAPPPPSRDDETAGNPGLTLNMPGGYRPHAGEAGPTATPSTPASSGNPTINVGGGYRPGGGPATPSPGPGHSPPPRPPVSAPPPRNLPPTEPAPQPRPANRPAREEPAAPPQPSPPTPEPAAEPRPAGAKPRPKTVIVSPDAIASPSTSLSAGISPEVEARLHQAMPRVFVKGENIKRRVRLMKVRSKLGRAETADVLLPHESVSEWHAEIEFDGANWALRDCGSTNGTMVDGAVLRGRSQPIARNALLGFGSLRGLFVCVDPATAARERRTEERALRALVASGRLPREIGKQVLAMARSDTSQTIGELLLAETAIEAADWASAYADARARGGMLDRLRRMFSRQAKPTPP